MSRFKKAYLVNVDILGFEQLAKIISDNKGIDSRDVRKKFKDVIQRKIEELDKDKLLISTNPGRDDWLLAFETQKT